jgi:tRNA modification GTPase
VEFATDDAIVAIATPPGRSGIGVVRLSGPGVAAIAARILDLPSALVPRYATLARTIPALDETICTYFQAPHSYTGQDVIEISAHGNPVLLHGLVSAALHAGARLAAPGEFTLRAFLNGKRDLVQAEAVGDLIAAATPLQARVAFDQLDGTLTSRIADIDAPLFELIARLEASLDFPDEGYHFVEPADVAENIRRVISDIRALLQGATRGRIVREGATVVIAGRTNVGKSSIFNKLVGYDRAIVTPVAGTTRDLVHETIEIEGLAVSLVDTAGWRETVDVVEREGVRRGERARMVAQTVLVVLDRSQPLIEDDLRLIEETADGSRVVVFNKCDLVRSRTQEDCVRPESVTPVYVSAATGDGFEDLRTAIAASLVGEEPLRDTPAISNVRHIALLEAAYSELDSAERAVRQGDTPEEFLLTHLHAARGKLDEIVGHRTSEDVLRHIFEKFCIGK